MLKIKDDVNLEELEKFGFRNVTLGNKEQILYKPKKTEREYARQEGRLYFVRKKYERGMCGEVCVQLNYLDTGEDAGEEWERHLKISSKLINLIEKGDYVNGYLVLDLDLKNEMICLLMPFNEENQSKYNIVWNTKYFIKSIVTHEQFEQIKYKVKEV